MKGNCNENRDGIETKSIFGALVMRPWGFCTVSEFNPRKKEYRQMAERLRDLAMVARHPEIQAEMTWLADSYDRLADGIKNGEGTFHCRDNPSSHWGVAAE
ncbi:MAG TPA: hypothetical protein VGM17_08305 [Rhizomicrobium sp.]